MSLNAEELLYKALKEGGIYSIFDNVTSQINRTNAKELNIPYESTDSGGEYGNKFRNAFSWSANRGGSANSFLIDAQNVEVLPGEDRDRKVVQKILNTYKNYKDEMPELVAALDLLKGKLTPEETRQVAGYAGTAKFVESTEREVQSRANTLRGYQNKLAQEMAMPTGQPTYTEGVGWDSNISDYQQSDKIKELQYKIAEAENALNDAKFRLSKSVQTATEQYNPELNILSSYELKDYSNLTDRYNLQESSQYNPFASAQSKIASGEQLSTQDLVALANQRGQNKSARQLEQELGLAEGTFRSAIIDDLGRQYTSNFNFWKDDPVIQERVKQSTQAYNLARATTGKVDVSQADVDRAVQAMPTMSAKALTQASATAQGLVNAQQAQQAQPVQQIGQIQNMQPQGLMNQIVSDTPFQTYGTTQQYLGQDLENIKLSNVKNYLSSLDDGSYLSLARRILGF